MKHKTHTPDRDRINVTLSAWLRDESARYGAKRGYGMSELEPAYSINLSRTRNPA